MTDAVASQRPDLLAQADALLELRRQRQALEVLAPLLAGSDDQGALCRASLALLGLGELPEARTMAERAIAAAPLHEWGHRLRALALLRQARSLKGSARAQALTEAALSAAEAVRLAPDQVATYHVSTSVHLATGRYGAAAESSRRAVELAPHAASTWVLCSTVDLDPSSPLSRSAAARNAERNARRALELDANSASAWNNLGAAMSRMGRWRDASTAFAQAARLDPTLKTPQDNLRAPAMVILRVVTALALLPLAFLPQGSAVYVAAYLAVLILRHPRMPLHRYADELGVKIALRIARTKRGGRLVQASSLKGAALLSAFAPLIGYGLGAPRTSGPVLAVTLVVVYGFLIWNASLGRRRAVRSPQAPAAPKASCPSCGPVKARAGVTACPACGAHLRW